MYRYILFDLDGTLTDPKVGICTCVQYALGKMGIVEEDLDKLEPFIGPPLDESFREFYGLNDEDIKKAIGFYRERYADVGKFENEVYPGIPELLRDLKRKGRTLAIASSKPTDFVDQILEHFEIKEYFDVIVGSNMDGTRSRKIEVIEEAIRQLFFEGDPEFDDIVMIGDRKFDIESSLEAGIRNVGVSYGYGSREELEAAGADKIVNTVAGLRATLLPMVGEDTRAYQMRTESKDAAQTAAGQSGENSEGPRDYREMVKNNNKKQFANIWGMIGPVATYKVGAFSAFVMLSLFSQFILPEEFVIANVYQLTAIFRALGAVLLCAFLVKAFIHIEKKEKEKPAPELLFKAEPLIWALSTIFLAAGLNGTALNAPVQEVSAEMAEAMQQAGPSMAEMKASLPLWLVLLLYGIVMPIVEEFIYTGFSYRRARRFMQPMFAYVVMIVLFSFTKNYTIEGIAGFIVYAVVLYAFSRYPKMWFAMLVHAVASLVVHLQDFCQPFGKLFAARGLNSVLSALGLLGVCMMIYMSGRKNRLENKAS